MQTGLVEVGDAERQKQVEGLLHVRHDVHPVNEAHRLLGFIFEKLTRANNAAGEVKQFFEGAQIACSHLLLQRLHSYVFAAVLGKAV